MNIETELGSPFDQLQIKVLNFSYDDAWLKLTLVHQSGGKTVTLTLKNVRRYLIEMPPFQVDVPYNISKSTAEQLDGDGSGFLGDNGYAHLDKNGDINTFKGEKAKLYHIALGGDVNLDVVFESYGMVKREY